MKEIWAPNIHWLCSLFRHRWRLAGSSTSWTEPRPYVHDRRYACARGCSVSLGVFNRAALKSKPG